MAPADIRKEGSSYDLPLAVGILAADEKITCGEIESYVMIGELSLDGTLQPVKGALPIALRARDKGFNGVVVPVKNARKAALVRGRDVYGMENVKYALKVAATGHHKLLMLYNLINFNRSLHCRMNSAMVWIISGYCKCMDPSSICGYISAI
jgi:predicted ATPase with chaperone activity